MNGLNTEELEHYSRHIRLPEVGVEGQLKLKHAAVLLVGAGGLGSPLALYLAASGVGRIGIIDFDVVEKSNLQRQVIFQSADAGKKKALTAKTKLLALNPHIQVDVYEDKLTSQNALELLEKYDIVADGTDNFPTRYLVNDVCMMLGKPNVYASIFGFEGQASVFVKNEGPCYRCLFPNPPASGSVPSCSEAGVLGVLPGILGTIQATEVIKLILQNGNPLIGRLLTYDALEMSFNEISLQRNPDCPVCGDHPTITEPIDYEDFCRSHAEPEDSAAAIEPPTLQPKELKKSIEAGADFILLDVRDPYELDICKLPGVLHIPMAEVGSRLNELPKDKDIVVICHLGVRSQNVARLLMSNGFNRVSNLNGGMDAYAATCDLDMPRY